MAYRKGPISFFPLLTHLTTYKVRVLKIRRSGSNKSKMHAPAMRRLMIQTSGNFSPNKHT